MLCICLDEPEQRITTTDEDIKSDFSAEPSVKDEIHYQHSPDRENEQMEYRKELPETPTKPRFSKF